MAGYKLATYESAEGPRAGAVISDLVYDVAALTGQAKYASVLDVLADWDNAHKLLDAASKAPKGDGKPVKRTKLLAPVRWPGTIYCAGANYQDHAEEMWKAAGQPPQPDPHEPRTETLVLHQGGALSDRPRRESQHLKLLQEDGLGGRARRGDRPQARATSRLKTRSAALPVIRSATTSPRAISAFAAAAGNLPVPSRLDPA